MTTEHPDQLDDFDRWFELSYCNYAVVAHTDVQRMPQPWRLRFAQMTREFIAAFAHVPQAGRYLVIPAVRKEVGELDPEELDRMGITRSEPEEGEEEDFEELFYDRYHDQVPAWEEIMVHAPGAQPIAAEVFPRALLQSMPPQWQHEMVGLLRQIETTIEEPLVSARVEVQAFRDGEWRNTTDPVPHYRRAPLIEPRLES